MSEVFDFQSDNEISTICNESGENVHKYKFKDSYTIKIQSCIPQDYDKESHMASFNLSKQDNELENFYGEILVSIGLEDGDCSIDDNIIKTQIKDDTVIESFEKLKKFKVSISIVLSTFSIVNGKLIADFDLVKIIKLDRLDKLDKLGKLGKGSVSVSIDDLIKNNYMEPIQTDNITTNLKEIYYSSSITTSIKSVI